MRFPNWLSNRVAAGCIVALVIVVLLLMWLNKAAQTASQPDNELRQRLANLPPFLNDLLPRFDYAVIATSPVDLTVTDAAGRTISKEKNEFRNAMYAEVAVRNITEGPIDIVLFQRPSFKPEDLTITVTLGHNAQQEDTFSVFTLRTTWTKRAKPRILAHNQLIGNESSFTYHDR